MSIQLKGNDNSSFSDDVVIGGGKIELNANGYISAAGANFATDFNGTADTFIVSASQNGTYQGQISYDTNADLTGYAVDFAGQAPVPVKWQLKRDGSATFASIVRSTNGTNQVYIAPSGIAGGTTVADTFTINSNNGSAVFKGGTSQSNVFINLDTGGVLDVKERLQNTQAILYRLKAALIQPDADVNTLRQRLLEALDILTSDGDES